MLGKKHKIEMKVHLVCITLHKFKQKARTLKGQKECAQKLVVANIFKQLHCNFDSQVLNCALKYIRQYVRRKRNNKRKSTIYWYIEQSTKVIAFYDSGNTKKMANVDNINDFRVISAGKREKV